MSINKSPKFFQGSLTLGQNHIEFNSEDEFRETVSNYMLKELNLQEVPYWQKDKDIDGYGQIQYMGWQNFIYALFISGSNLDSIIGEHSFGGSAGRLLSMYIGLSWFETAAILKTYCKSITEKDKIIEKSESKYQEVNKEEIKRITTEINILEQELKELPDMFNSRIEKIQESISGSKKLNVELTNLNINKNKMHTELEAIEEALNSAKQELIDIKETQNINSFIKKLTPEFCPRCDSAIKEEYKQRELDQNICSVCGEVHSSKEDIENYQEHLDEATNRVNRLQEAYDKFYKEITNLEKHQEAIEYQLTCFQNILNNKESNSETEIINKQKEIELKISKLKGMLEVRSHYCDKKSNKKSLEKTNDDYKVLNAAKNLAEANLKESQSVFFEALNKAVLALAQRFGMDAIESINIDGGARMLLQKGGAPTSFSKVTAGERLRLKIALIIGMLRVAAEKGVGRHPGLLLIDSLGNEEIGEKDFKFILSELTEIAKEINGLQVIITSAKFDGIVNVVDSSRIIAPEEGEKYIW